MKKYLSLLILFCSYINAEESQLINQLHSKYNSISYYQSSFIQTKIVSYISKPLITKGQLEFALNQGLIWEVTHPLWVKTLITKDGEIFKSTKYHDKQLVKDFQIKLISEIMTELLTANLDKIDGHFKINAIDKGETWQINLTPKKMMLKKTLKQIQLKGKRIDNHIQDIQEIAIIDNAENETTIQLSKTLTSEKLIDAELRAKFE